MQKPIYYLLLLLFLTACTGSSQLSLNERYPADWREAQTNEALAISRVLSQNNISGCGQYFVKTYIDGGDEYLVGCTEDGNTWNYYQLMLTTREVTSIKDSGITAPELHKAIIR